jgi:anti-sigma factor RsiW
MTARIDHGVATERFSPYVDRELAPAEERELLLHLETCPACRKEYEAFARALSLVRGAERVRPRPGFERRVVKKLRPRRRRALARSANAVAVMVSVEAAIPLLIALGVAVLLVLLAP